MIKNAFYRKEVIKKLRYIKERTSMLLEKEYIFSEVNCIKILEYVNCYSSAILNNITNIENSINRIVHEEYEKNKKFTVKSYKVTKNTLTK